MSTKSKPLSLLSTLSSSQVDALIYEEELKDEGYKIFFCIDSDDLHNYSYPLDLYGDRPDTRNIDYEYITDEQIALYSCFKSDSFKAFLFKEHYEEFESLIYTLRVLHNNHKEVINTVDRLIVELKARTEPDLQNLEVSDDNMDSVRKNISLILSIAVGLQAEGVQKLFQLKREKKIFFTVEEFSASIGAIRQNVFDEIKVDKELLNSIYDFLKEYEKKGGNDKNKDADFNLDSIKRNVSLHRDSAVIGKMLALNSYLQSINEKKIVFYISSDNKTQNVFYRKASEFEKINDEVERNLIVIDDRLVNCHRTTAQIFLRLLCEEEDRQDAIRNLKEVKEILLIKEQREKFLSGRLLKHHILAVDTYLADKIEQCRRKYARYATFDQIGSFKELTISPKGEKPVPQDYLNVLDILSKMIKEREKDLTAWRTFSGAQLKELSQLAVMRNSIVVGLDRILQNQVTTGGYMEIDAGEDFIYGSDHYMPTYFVGKDKNEPGFYEIIEHLKDSSDDLKQILLTFATKLFSSTENEDELVLKRGILVLMLTNSETDSDRVSAQLENILDKYDFKGSPYESDFYYLLTWVMRRNRHYDEAVERAKIARIRFPDDPRFYHSISLAIYCQFQEAESSGQPNADILLDSLDYADRAIELYEMVQKNLTEQHPGYKYIRQNICALLNTRIYIMALGYKEDKMLFPGDILKEARTSLLRLKKLDPEYNYKPEFLQTEAFLELQEFEATGYTLKLNMASLALETALKLPRITKRLRVMCLTDKEFINTLLNQPKNQL